MSNMIPMVERLPHLPPSDVLHALRTAFTKLAEGSAVQPPQTLMLLPGGGDVIAYQAALDDTYGLKISPYLPRTGRSAVVTAWTLVMSTRTGRPLLLCDAHALTVERTAATSALAVDHLARPEAATLAVIGSGPQAHAHLRYARAVRAFASVRMYAPTLTEAKAPDGVTVAHSAEEAAAGADVVLLCTSAAQPVIDAAALPPGTVVTSISTNAPRAHEIPPAALPAMEVYGDYRPTVTTAAGEMVLAAEADLWSAEQLRGDLPELLTGGCLPPSGARPVLFRSIGLGIEDLAVARLLECP
ncbi:ornithine cyclodeaminase family protein [Streptomyces sp. GS7]|uniref:ornithine cyclodeaminase family protein n=1 Tax=Streptomyces sp. GS7 TaxID=2692234 RepID=UPI0013196FAD|nr:ornithine cyclodeaminase family protein [Streptomyces sp. GS7]QHC25034.1 ornithine cyclodeaminase family protein [Streptomyces sp. GS7]